MIKSGQRFGALTVIRVASNEERLPNKFKRTCYILKCDCGEVVVKQDRSLTRSTGTDYSMKKRANRFSCDKCREIL